MTSAIIGQLKSPATDGQEDDRQTEGEYKRVSEEKMGSNNTALTFNKDGFYSDIFGVMIMSYDCFHAHMSNVVQLEPFSDHSLRI